MKLALEECGRPRNGQRNPPPNVAPINLVDPPEEEDEQEDDNDVIQSDVVSDYANLHQQTCSSQIWVDGFCRQDLSIFLHMLRSRARYSQMLRSPPIHPQITQPLYVARVLPLVTGDR